MALGARNLAHCACLILQASFDPPGLTVAVKKDRAVENLMGTGSEFVVNILAEGNHKKLMSQLSKPFQPGQNRFEGLDIEVCNPSSPKIAKFAGIPPSKLLTTHLPPCGMFPHQCWGMRCIA